MVRTSGLVTVETFRVHTRLLANALSDCVDFGIRKRSDELPGRNAIHDGHRFAGDGVNLNQFDIADFAETLAKVPECEP